MIKAGFISLTILMAIILFGMASSVAGRVYSDVSERKRFKMKLGLFLACWVFYSGGIALTGVFANTSFPPRIPILLVLPAFASFIWALTRRGAMTFIRHTPASWPVYLQSFRIVVEILIYGCVVQGILPLAASFAGYNFDILIGITAPVMAWFFIREGRRTSGIILAWNIAGLATLAVVVFILISQAYFFRMWGASESILNKGFGLFPYTYLAGFLMPVAVFLHIFSIIKTRQLMK